MTERSAMVVLGLDDLQLTRSETAHGFRNIGEQPLLVISVHEAETIELTWLGRDPA